MATLPGTASLALRAIWQVARQRQSRHRVLAPLLYSTTADLILSSAIGR